MEYSNPVLRKQVGERIRDRRESLGWLQTDLAKRADIKQGQVSKLEIDDHKIDALVLARVAAALGVSTDWLLGLDENPRPVPELVGDELELLKIYRARPDRQPGILEIVKEATKL